MSRRYNRWTLEQEHYLTTRRAQGAYAHEIASELGMTTAQVQNKVNGDVGRFPLGPRPSVWSAPQEVTPAPAPAPPLPEPPAPVDPVEEARARRERTKALREENDALQAVAGERSLRAMLGSLLREVTASIDPPPRYRAPKALKGTVQETALFQWSDWHYGEVVLSERVRGFNAYNPAVAAQSVRDTVTNGRSILERLRTGGYRFSRSVVAVNGDLVTGTIHDLERNGDGKNIVQHVVACGYLLAEALRDLAADFEQVDAFCTVGNHGRLPDARRMEQKAPLRNWDAVVYYLAQAALLSVPNVRLTIPDAYAVGYEIDGHAFLQQHGHDVKSWGSGLPWYGLQRYTARLEALEARRNQRIDYFLFGHFHNPSSLPNYFINGSLIGATEFSINALGSADAPTQWLVGVHPEKGVTHSWRVYPNAARVGTDEAAA